MHLFFRFAYIHWLYIAIPLFIVVLIIRQNYTRLTIYQYPLVGYLSNQSTKKLFLPTYILYFLRLFICMTLLTLLAKPQLVDQKSKVTVEGIDIMMVLDISRSMELFDDLNDRRPRITIAKEQAIRFVEKRHNDEIGLVVFGNYAITRCPLTPDKVMLKSMIKSIKMNDRDSIHDGTVISQAVITAARRLQKSKAISRIIILLTDGAPSQHDYPASQAIEIAKSFGIKVYTIGIGNNGLAMQNHPRFGMVPQQMSFNTDLLEKLADETGGKFFDVKKAQDIAKIYDAINALEKSKYQDNVFTKYHDYFIPFIWIALFLIFTELILSTFVWTIL